MKNYLKIVLCVALAFPLSGCGVVAAFPAIAAVVSDAVAVLNIIQQAVNTWFVHKPDQELQLEINNALTETWGALRVATAATKGAENLSQEEYDAAFADFQSAYTDLHELLKRQGILKGNKLSMGPEQHGEEIPPPLAMNHLVR